MSCRRFCCLLAALVPVYLLLAAAVPPFDDEFYYWCWAQELQLSYYDHPPMVAYMIRAATAVFGDSVLAMRLPAVVSALVVVGVIAWLSRPASLLPFVIASPVLTFAAILVTPDTPMLMFWALYLAWLVKVHARLAMSESEARRPTAGLWVLGGLILGCGILGKYTTALAGLAGLASFACAGRPGRWLAGYALHAGVAFLVASPILIHNIRYDFVPLRYQWEHSMSSPEPGLSAFGEFVAIQFFLLGSVPFVIFLWAVWNGRELLADPRLRPAACLFVLPFAFFLFKATRGRLEGNWAFPCYIACWPLAAVWYARVRESTGWWWATRAGFAAPVVFTVFLVVHMIEPVPFLPVSADRPTRQWSKVAVARQVARDLRAAGYEGPVYAPTYQWTALLRWCGLDARQMPGYSRPSHFTERPEPPPDPARLVVFLESPERLGVIDGFGPTRGAASYPVVVRGREYSLCWVFDCSDPAAGIGRRPVGDRAGRLDRTAGDAPR